jgi:pyruvate kinase
MRSPSEPVQLIATLGPASWPLARALSEAVATAFRLNASHLDAGLIRERLAAIRRELPSAEIVLDLQGAKMRLGTFAAREVARGARMTFGPTGSDIPLPHPELAAQATPGDTLTVDDGRVRLGVESVSGGRIACVVLEAGRLLPRKGVNVEEHPVRLGSLTPQDREAILAGCQFGVRSFAFSFMADGSEAAWVRAAAPDCRVVGKVERREAVAAGKRQHLGDQREVARLRPVAEQRLQLVHFHHRRVVAVC